MAGQKKRRRKQSSKWPWVIGAGGGVLVLLVAVFVAQLGGTSQSQPQVDSTLVPPGAEDAALEAEMVRAPT